MSWKPCCCPGPAKRVLMWNANKQFVPVDDGGAQARDFFRFNMGLRTDDFTEFSGNIHDYQLVIWGAATSNPSWWASITNNSWHGRLVISAENLTEFPESVAYVNGLQGTTGIGILGDTLDDPRPPCFYSGPVLPDPLTQGFGVLLYHRTSQTVGGTSLALVRPISGIVPWIARNKPAGSNRDFVVAADIDWYVYRPTCDSWPFPENHEFLRNLVTVPI